MSRDGASCPRCAAPLAQRVGEVPWCGACEWNLVAFDRLTVRSEWGNRVLDRFSHWVAFRLDGYGFRRWVGRPVRREGGRVGRAVVLAVAALGTALGPAALVGGVYLMIEGPGLTPFLGLILALFAVAVRPRFARGLPAGLWVVTRASAPTLFVVLERVATAVGAPMPDVVGFTARVNAPGPAGGVARRG